MRTVLSLTSFMLIIMVFAGALYAHETEETELDECKEKLGECEKKLDEYEKEESKCKGAEYEYELDKCSDKYRFRPHKKNYFMFGKVQADKTFDDQSDSEGEANFQVSVKVPIKMGKPLYFSYTQKSFWILTCCSKPFRQSNYNPEFFLDFQKIDKKGAPKEKWEPLAGLRVGLWEHESNGSEDKSGESRGWNRYGYFEIKSKYWTNAKLDRHLAVNLKVWPYSSTSSPDSIDMEDYFGHGEVSIEYERKRLFVGGMARKGSRPGTFSYQIDLGYKTDKVDIEGLWLYAKYWNGVGESLYEYNKKTSRLLFGVLLAR